MHGGHVVGAIGREDDKPCRHHHAIFLFSLGRDPAQADQKLVIKGSDAFAEEPGPRLIAAFPSAASPS